MKIPNEKIILKTNNWIVNNRIDSSLPGYVILQSRHNHMNLCDLSNKAIQEMGILMGYIEKTLKKFIFLTHFYIYIMDFKMHRGGKRVNPREHR
ncbi:tRNA glutamyl-Q synthetase [Xenorhabdus sp. KJ12.1]|nr:tRNA glutamyl-Q synthetase [Xenorhabdus sp. KJ12.1]